MDEHPNVHENLVAKCIRQCGSESSLVAESRSSVPHFSRASDNAATDVQQLVAANGAHSRRTLYLHLLEPMILLLLFAYNFSATVLKNQIIYQTCTAIFGYNDTDCRLLGTRNTSEHTMHIETEVQPYAARIFTVMSVIQSVLTAFLGLFMGAWADRYGRKPLLQTAYLGFALQYTFSAGLAYQATISLVSPWYYVLTILPLSLLGSSSAYSVAAYCHIADVSNQSTRSYRMMFYEICIHMGLMFGSFTSGYVYEATNSVVVFSISAMIIIGAFLVIAAFLPESLPENNTAPANTQQTVDLQQLLRDLWQTCCKPRIYNDRSIVGLIMATLLLATFVGVGQNTLFYLFIREQFHWTLRQFTTYESVSILVPAVAGYGGMLFLWQLRKCCNSSIIILAIIALISQVASSFTKAFAFVDWQIYVAIGLGLFKSLLNPMCHTIITNLVPADERGKIFSLLSVMQTLLPFAASTVYTVIYGITLPSFPGFFNILSANLYIIAVILLLVVCRQKRLEPTHYEAAFK